LTGPREKTTERFSFRTQQSASGCVEFERVVVMGFSRGGRTGLYNTVVHSHTKSEYEMDAAMTADKFCVASDGTGKSRPVG